MSSILQKCWNCKSLEICVPRRFFFYRIRSVKQRKFKFSGYTLYCGTSHHRTEHVVCSYKALTSLASWYSFILCRNIRVMVGISLIYPPISTHIIHYSVRVFKHVYEVNYHTDNVTMNICLCCRVLMARQFQS